MPGTTLVELQRDLGPEPKIIVLQNKGDNEDKEEGHDDIVDWLTRRPGTEDGGGAVVLSVCEI